MAVCDCIEPGVGEARSALGCWVQVVYCGPGAREQRLAGICVQVEWHEEAVEWGRVLLDLRADVPGIGSRLWLDLDAGWAIEEIGDKAFNQAA